MVKEAAEEVGVSDVVPEMVERVAKAMCRAAMVDPDFCAPTLSARGEKPQWQHKVGLARAAITAMREPTTAMADAGRWPGEDGEPMEAWRLMVDAALSPPDGQKP